MVVGELRRRWRHYGGGEAIAAVAGTTMVAETMAVAGTTMAVEAMVVASITDITAETIATMAATGAITVATAEPIITRPTPTRITRMANVRGSTGRP